MVQTKAELETDLSHVRQAIKDCVQLQSYSKPGLSANRAQLSELRRHEKDLMRRLAKLNGSGGLVLTVIGGTDTTGDE